MTDMRFGLHYLLSCGDGQDVAQRYRDTLDQAVHGEALGFESVWPVEQHFDRTASALSCPTLLLANLAARTRRIRLGTAIVQLPLSHPVRVAEELATLDLLSGGRAELGVGRGSNPLHFAGFGVPMADSRARLEEGIALVRALFAGPTTHRGRFFEVEDLSIVPRPLQPGGPPLRLAANSVDTATLAAELGLPILVASNVNPLPRLAEIVAAHRAAGGGDVTVLMPLFVDEDRDRLRAAVAPSVAHMGRVVAALPERLLARGCPPEERARLEPLLARMRAMTYDSVNDLSAIFDTPDRCLARLDAVRSLLAPSRIICWFNFGGLVPHDAVLRSMELFATRVMPRM